MVAANCKVCGRIDKLKTIFVCTDTYKVENTKKYHGGVNRINLFILLRYTSSKSAFFSPPL